MDENNPEIEEILVTEIGDGEDIDYEVWEDGFVVMSSTSIKEAIHYMSFIAEGNNIGLVEAKTTRRTLMIANSSIMDE